MAKTNKPEPSGSSDRTKRMQSVLDKCLQRRAAGEDLSDETIIAENPELMPELAERLRALKLIEDAGRQSDGSGASGQAKKSGNEVQRELDGATPPKIRHYQVVRLLGRGGMGEVWLAREPILDRDVALKILSADWTQDKAALRRFLREARAAAKLNHPNVITIFQVGRAGDHVYIAMELVQGRSLSDELRQRGPFPWREATKLIRDAASGLAAADAQGLIHRDIKPGNLMRGLDGVLKIVDFGLARAQTGNIDITKAGSVIGTPAYMSPEQAKGQALDIRSDIYSLTCTYYALLTGRSPYRGDSVATVLYQHVHEALPDPRQAVPDLPEPVCRILARGAAKAPAQRYQTPAEMLEDLDAVISETSASNPELHALAAAASGRKREKAEAKATTDVDGGRTLRSWWWAALAALVVLAPTITWLAVRDGDPPTPPDDSALVAGGDGTIAKPPVRPPKPIPLALPPSVVTVRSAATGKGDGTSWSNAYKDLQDALAAAQPGAGIWVAAGTYRPDRGTGDRAATFQLKSGVALYGGFAGTETSLNQRDPNTHKTILSGDLKGDDDPNFVNREENSYHVVTGSGTDESAVLDGFSITAGYANGLPQAGETIGAGMYNNGGSPSVRNCIFLGNATKGPIGSNGGGMLNIDDSSPMVLNCRFERNMAGWDGGGVGNSRGSSPILRNCTFVQNRAANNGGAMFNWWSAEPKLSDCVFTENTAGTDGGAIGIGNDSAPSLERCTFTANFAKSEGGAIFIGGGQSHSVNADSRQTKQRAGAAPCG